MALKRLMQEYRQIVKEPSPYYSIMEPDQKTFYILSILIFHLNFDLFTLLLE